MSRIGSLTSLAGDQMRALRRLQTLSREISENTRRLSTLKRINQAKDDPAGLVHESRLQAELTATEAASKSVTRAGAMLNTADAAAGEVVTQLQQARALVLEAAGGGLSDEEVAANQVEVDAILRSIDNLSRTSFAGKQLLNGASGFRVSGTDTAQVLDVDILDKTTADDVIVNVNVTSTATQASDTYTGGALAEDVTLIVQGSTGTATISLAAGSSLADIEEAFNAATYETGITATVNGGNINLKSTEYGSDATISIEATEGTFTLANGGSATGTDAVATINGQSYTGDGSTFSVNSSTLSMTIELAPTASGALDSFVVSGQGLSFNVGTSAGSRASIGLPNLHSSSLGGVSGKLSSIRSGGDNSLTSGNAATALAIIDDALGDATRSQAIIGGFQKFTLDSASRVLESQEEHLSTALSDVQDTDIALETALLTRNRLLEQTALEALSVASVRQQDILGLLRNAATRY
ncbi:MAG: flagellin [Planctomycetaceae bacterium]